MSREAYQTIIKPVHKRMYDAAAAFDMIPVQHTCGKAESIVEDMIEIGVKAWTSVQPTNDIETILQKYGDQKRKIRPCKTLPCHADDCRNRPPTALEHSNRKFFSAGHGIFHIDRSFFVDPGSDFLEKDPFLNKRNFRKTGENDAENKIKPQFNVL